jgi:hypothetical protein
MALSQQQPRRNSKRRANSSQKETLLQISSTTDVSWQLSFIIEIQAGEERESKEASQSRVISPPILALT